MDITRLKYFCAIVETGSMRKAAELLSVSPSALSKAMRLLESEAGGRRLFIASGRGVVITDEGQLAYDKARAVLRAVAEFDMESTHPKYAKPLRVGSFEVFTTHFFGKLMKEYYPERGLVLHELLPGQMEEALSKSQIDIAITYLPIPRPGLDFIEVTRVGLGVFTGKNPSFSTKRFEEIPFVLPVPPLVGSPNKVKGMDGWPDDALPRNGKYQVTMLETALALCRQGLAAAYLPKFLVHLHNESANPAHRLVEIPAPKGVPSVTPAYLIKRQTDVENEAMRVIAKAMRAICFK